MTTRQLEVERLSVISNESFDRVVANLEALVGRPDMQACRRDITRARTTSELAAIVQQALGASGLMEFTRFDIGEILRKDQEGKAPRILRLVIGNPLIMKQMVVHVPDAASYAPVTILVDERPDGVHLSYDRVASFLAYYGSLDALRVAHYLDTKVEALLMTAAGAESQADC